MWYRIADNFQYEKERVISEEDKGLYILKKVETNIGLESKDKPVSLTYAVSKVDGCYIGNEKTAKMLAEKGISPERAQKDCNVCSIGYSEQNKKWYGWSHRAIQGFGIGDKAKTLSPWGSTSSEKAIETDEEAKQAAIDFADSVD